MIAPTASGLQCLINKFNDCIIELDLSLNANKSAVIIFNKKLKTFYYQFYVANTILNIVDHYKYLGIVLTENLCNVQDIERCTQAFNKSFAMLFRKFNSLSSEVVYQLFLSYCSCII